YALIEINDPTQTRAGLESEDPFKKRAGLIALDQMDRGDLKVNEVTPFLDTRRGALLNQTANWIISHRKEWAGPIASYLEAELLNHAGNPGLRERLQSLASAPAMQAMLAGVAGRESAPREARLLSFDVLREA